MNASMRACMYACMYVCMYVFRAHLLQDNVMMILMCMETKLIIAENGDKQVSSPSFTTEPVRIQNPSLAAAVCFNLFVVGSFTSLLRGFFSRFCNFFQI